MNDELYHFNTKGSHWYINGPGKRFQAHAQYAMGMSNPDVKPRIDPKTGFKLKNGESSVESDMYFTNPNRNDPSDPLNNCVACTATYELRRRGYDVTVKKDNKRDITATHDRINEYFPNAMTANFGATDDYSIMGIAQTARVGKNMKLANDVNKALLSQGNGARGAIGTLYTTRSGLIMGHEMAWEVKGNKVHIYDSQLAEEKDCKDTLRYCVGAFCTRLDNAKVNVKKVKGAAQ